MLRVLPFLVLGILAEHLSLRHAGVLGEYTNGILPQGFLGLCITILILLLLTVLLRRYRRVAGVFGCLAVVTLGMLVMENKSQSLHYSQNTHRYYDRDMQRGTGGNTGSNNLGTGGDAARERQNGGGIFQQLTHLRGRLMEAYRQNGLHGDALATVAAMTLGERQQVSKELREVYNISGGSHVFALSGLHLSIIFMLLTILLPWILPSWRWRNVGNAVALLVMWLYVMLVGFHASVVRAAVMLTLYGVGAMMSRFPRSIDIVMTTAFLLLIVCPHWLFDAGFQMSLAAVTSIILLYEKIYSVLIRAIEGMPGLGRLFRYEWQMQRNDSRTWSIGALLARKAAQFFAGVFSVSLAAQVGVAPLVAYYFHRFSCYFWLTNMLVSPLAVVIILLAIALLLAAMLPAWMSWLASTVAALLLFVVNGQNAYLRWVASLPGASIEDIRLSTVQLLLIYVIITAVVLLIRRLYSVFWQKNLED